jgi:ABC-type oligopeptide transport system substrate-binding subunit
MKKVIAVLATVILTIAVSAPSFAQQAQTPKGTEGPDVRRGENKTHPEGPDIRKSKKSPKASVVEKGTEGPNTRQKQEPKAAMDAGGRQSQEKKAQ